MTSDPERASFIPQTGPAAGQPIKVHFNPEKLQIDITNTLEDQGQGQSKKQYVTKSSAKLAMELLFDTTDDGSDVRVQTGKIAKLMEPGQPDGAQGAPPSVVLFEWGAFKFQGLIESYKESLDFFSSNGVPLRANVSLSLASQDAVFERLASGDASRRAEPFVQTLAPGGESLTAVASRGGNPAAARAIAAANGLETMRLATGAIALSDAIPLAPPLAFDSAGASTRMGALRSPAGSGATRPRLDLGQIRNALPLAAVAGGPAAGFQVGGQAVDAGPGGLKADVGATKRLQDRLQFR